MTEPAPQTHAPRLGGVPETLLIPLYFRAAETQRPDAIVRDPKAVEIVRSLDYDFDRFSSAWMSQIDMAVRTDLLDRAVRRFVSKHPAGTIVTLGAGLDGRFWRIDNGQIQWFDLDLPEVIELRRRYFAESDRNRFLPRSLLDFAWLDELNRPQDQPLLIIAEGVFHYFTEQEVRSLFAEIAARLPGAELLFHSTSPRCLKYHRRSKMMKTFDARFKWGIESGREVLGWVEGLEFVNEWAFVDQHRPRWRYLRWASMLPFVGRELRSVMKITHVRFPAR